MHRVYNISGTKIGVDNFLSHFNDFKGAELKINKRISESSVEVEINTDWEYPVWLVCQYNTLEMNEV
jgi:hypothetical protein